jgi:methyl-accepting chemotaxis protein
MKKPRLILRRVLVDGLQNRLIAVSALHFVLIVLVFASALLVPLIGRMSIEGAYDEEVVAAAHQFLNLHYHLWPPLFLTLALLTLHNIIITHRIAGPLWRIRRELAAIGNGDLSRVVRIRPRDYMCQEADAINSMTQSLRARVERIDERNEAATAALARLESAARDNDKDRFDAALNDLRTSLGLALAVLNEFETGREPHASPAARDAELQPVTQDA